MLKRGSPLSKIILRAAAAETAFFEAIRYLCSCQKLENGPKQTVALWSAEKRLQHCQRPVTPGRNRPRYHWSLAGSNQLLVARTSHVCGRIGQQYSQGSWARSMSSCNARHDEAIAEPAIENTARRKTPIKKKPWPKRLHDYFGSLPVRNYANDFVLWDMTADDLWTRYELLPSPRCQAVSRTALRFILSSLAAVKPKTRKGLFRYEAIINEMKAQDPPIAPLKEEWNALISFHARVHKRPGIADVDKCMELWYEMESTYAIRANRVTFNILLDVSTKTCSWQTVDLLLQEMQSRHMPFDRYTWTTLVHAAGLRKDGTGVRNLARSMLDRGEVLDVVVMNAIISALIRSNNHSEAERLFKSMKDSNQDELNILSNQGNVTSRHRSSTYLASQYQFRAKLNQQNINAGLELTREDISSTSSGSDRSYPMPDAATYNMILNDRCVRVGNFASVGDLLEEMYSAKIPDTEAMFESLFHGFYVHGRHNLSWSLPRLRYIFETFLNASNVKITQTLAIKAIRAFSRLGTRDEVISCYDALDQAWRAQGGDHLRRSENVLQAYQVALMQYPGTSKCGTRSRRVAVHDGLKDQL